MYIYFLRELLEWFEGHWHCVHSEMGTFTLKLVALFSKAMEVYLHDSCILML